MKWISGLLLVLINWAPQTIYASSELDKSLANTYILVNQLLAQKDSAIFADSLSAIILKAELEDEQTKSVRKSIALHTLELQRSRTRQFTEDIDRKVAKIRSQVVGVPVILKKDTVFFVYTKLGPYQPSERANNIAVKLDYLLEQNLFNLSEVHIEQGDGSTDIMYDDIILTSVTPKDEILLGIDANTQANEISHRVVKSIEAVLTSRGIWTTVKRVLAVIAVILIVFFGIRYLNKGFSWLNGTLVNKIKPNLKSIRFKTYEFLSIEREEILLRWFLKLLKWISIVFIVYLSLPAMFSIFPSTKGIATLLFGYITEPVKHFGLSLLRYIPNLLTIAVVIALTRYLIRALRFVSLEVESGKLQLPGFYGDWAKPTFNILKVVLYAFAFVIIFPYLPGSDSAVFQGVSVFFGLLISLGSSSAIGNIIAGLVITYMRAFKIGDRVKIGDTTGDVIEKTMLVTRVRTIKNEDVTIPNSAILNGSTINYSSSASDLGLILNTTVTIGYDVPWPKVHELLIAAALDAEGVDSEPKPFVLQTSLDDFYVSYQLNAYTKHPETASAIYSRIHANIQDQFNQAGVEILSPHYRAQRDGNTMAVPPDYLPKGYQAPKFNVDLRNTDK